MPSRDWDPERRSNLEPFVKAVRTSQTRAKQVSSPLSPIKGAQLAEDSDGSIIGSPFTSEGGGEGVLFVATIYHLQYLGRVEWIYIRCTCILLRADTCQHGLTRTRHQEKGGPGVGERALTTISRLVRSRSTGQRPPLFRLFSLVILYVRRNLNLPTRPGGCFPSLPLRSRLLTLSSLPSESPASPASNSLPLELLSLRPPCALLCFTRGEDRGGA
jgi:hypothetical protein